MTTTMTWTASGEMISGRERLRGHVARALARLRAQEALASAAVVLNISAALLAICIFAERLLSLEKLGLNVWLVWIALTALGIPYVLWRAYSPRIHHPLAAALADDRLRLHSRLSTALTLDLDDPASAAFSEAFFGEALRTLNALQVEQAFPIRLPRSARFSIVPLGAAALLFVLMPQLDASGLAANAEKKRQKLKPDILTEPKNEPSAVHSTMEKAELIANDLRDGKRSADDALAALAKLKRDIDNEKRKISRDADLSKLEKLTSTDLNAQAGAPTDSETPPEKPANPTNASNKAEREKGNETKTSTATSTSTSTSTERKETANRTHEKDDKTLDQLDQIEASVDEAMQTIDGGDQNSEPRPQPQGTKRDHGGRNAGDRSNNEDPNGRPGPGPGPGEGPRAENNSEAKLEAQKISGRIQPGAITGLSHFRGPGAKGDAPKEFITTLRATSQEAATSLEMERIPSDAREVVKDYFRAVKEAAGPDAAPVAAPNGK